MALALKLPCLCILCKCSTTELCPQTTNLEISHRHLNLSSCLLCESYWIWRRSQKTALEFVGLALRVAELNTEETILHVPRWNFLRDPRAHSFLPLVIIGDFLFSGYIVMSLLSSCGKSGLFQFIYSWMLTPMKLIQYFLHKYKCKHLALKYL